MGDLTTLLVSVKSFLGITWDDQDTDTQILSYINSGMRRIDDIAGTPLDYTLEEESEDGIYLSMCHMGRELLFNRVFYMMEKGLDDFESNFRGEVTSLYLLGRSYKDADEKE